MGKKVLVVCWVILGVSFFTCCIGRFIGGDNLLAWFNYLEKAFLCWAGLFCFTIAYVLKRVFGKEKAKDE